MEFSVFNYFELGKLLRGLKPTIKQKQLATQIQMTPQKINQIFSGSTHLVYPMVRKWRSALKMNRLDGDYFEFLALLAAFQKSTEKKQDQMILRAYHLTERLEVHLKPNKISDSLLYWLDPMVAVLRNAVDVDGFPVDEKEIPQWVADRITYIGILGNLRKRFPERIENAWKWLRRIDAVQFCKEENRWEKTDFTIYSKSIIGSELKDIQSVVFVLNQVVTYKDFSHEAGSNTIIGDRLATFSIASSALDFINEYSRDFIYGQMVNNVTMMCNKDTMEYFKKHNKKLYKELSNFKEELIAKGYEVPEYNDEDVDVTVQMLLSSRKVLIK